MPKGPWTKQLKKIPNFKENSLLKYKYVNEVANIKLHLLGYRMYKAEKVRNTFVHYGTTSIIVKAEVEAAMKKRVVYETTTSMCDKGLITRGGCSCAAGLGGRCKHVFALLWQLLDYVREECMFIKDMIPSTSKKRTWGTGSHKNVISEPLHKIHFIKPDPNKKVKKTLPNLLYREEVSSKYLIVGESFTKEDVNDFFNNLVRVLEKYQFSPSNILNIDETGLTTVLPAPKVVAVAGTKQVYDQMALELCVTHLKLLEITCNTILFYLL